MLIGVFALTAFAARPTSSPKSAADLGFSASGAVFPSVNAAVDSGNATSYSFDFTLLGNVYTAVVVTDSAVSNLGMSETGLGIQFQVSVPSGTSGFCSATVPAILFGTDIAVFEDGVLLAENVAYTQERSGAAYVFNLTCRSGTHTMVIEAAMSNVQTPSVEPSSTPSPLQNQSGIPVETIVTVAAAGAVAATSIAVFYSLKGTIHGSTAGKGGTEAAKTPPPSGESMNVPAGTNVTVHPNPKVRLTFSQVNQAGAVTATPVSRYPMLSGGVPFRGAVFEIKTAAVFAGLVIVGLLFDGADLSDEEKKKLRVYRNDLKKGSVWEDVTTSIDTENNIAYGSTDHFSLFGVH
jgi:hypothetical protein